MLRTCQLLEDYEYTIGEVRDKASLVVGGILYRVYMAPTNIRQCLFLSIKSLVRKNYSLIIQVKLDSWSGEDQLDWDKIFDIKGTYIYEERESYLSRLPKEGQ